MGICEHDMFVFFPNLGKGGWVGGWGELRFGMMSKMVGEALLSVFQSLSFLVS